MWAVSASYYYSGEKWKQRSVFLNCFASSFIARTPDCCWPISEKRVENCRSCFSHETKSLCTQRSSTLDNGFTWSNHVHPSFLDTSTCCTAPCSLFAHFHQDILFVFSQLWTYLLLATPSLLPGYAIKFPIRISLPTSEPSFLLRAALCLPPEEMFEGSCSSLSTPQCTWALDSRLWLRHQR